MVAHGVMFHHFHGPDHAETQGSISAEELSCLLDYLGGERILGASEWTERALNGSLRENDLCLTFDDALRSQIDIALPVLEKRNLTAFWFVYSEAFGAPVRNVEIFRAFRHHSYSDIDSFYNDFEARVLESPFSDAARNAIKSGVADVHLGAFDFYTRGDRRFRFLRDKVLGKDAYEEMMLDLMSARGFDISSARRLLWMNEKDLVSLEDKGHILGLHSFSHPTELNALSIPDQKKEYSANKEHLEKILNNSIIAMSHPCNSYSAETLDILNSLGIRIGFRSNMAVLDGGAFEMPRVDHANVMRKLRLR
jgi:peptidoglycan/xylan/chitin deacetylase (PgdA/CDA1 family)